MLLDSLCGVLWKIYLKAKKVRIDLHAALILAESRSWPGSLMGLRYDQVRIQSLRHPENLERVNLAATITAKQEKSEIKPTFRAGRWEQGSHSMLTSFYYVYGC